MTEKDGKTETNIIAHVTDKISMRLTRFTSTVVVIPEAKVTTMSMVEEGYNREIKIENPIGYHPHEEIKTIDDYVLLEIMKLDTLEEVKIKVTTKDIHRLSDMISKLDARTHMDAYFAVPR